MQNVNLATSGLISRADAKGAGLTRFFTGVPCKHGHVCERRVNNTSCVECHRLTRNQARDQRIGARKQARHSNSATLAASAEALLERPADPLVKIVHLIMTMPIEELRKRMQVLHMLQLVRA